MSRETANRAAQHSSALDDANSPPPLAFGRVLLHGSAKIDPSDGMKAMSTTTEAPPLPQLRTVTQDDVMASLRAGWADFRRAPAFGLFFGGVFSVIGIIIFLQLVAWGSGYWVLPIAAGFPLVGPFLAVGLYAVSQSLERGETPDWASVLSVPVKESARQIPWLAFAVLFVYFVWVYLANLIFLLSFGLKPMTGAMSVGEVLLSQAGIMTLIIGSMVGGAMAILLFSITVVSVPMLLDREIDVVTAMVTSCRCVLENRQPMLFWALIIGVATVAAMVPLFLGMIIVFPVLGHASWHLYRRAIEPA